MSTILPGWPHLLFAVLEPLSVIAAWCATASDPPFVVSSQHPNDASLVTLSPGTMMAIQQLGNVYLLLGLLGIAVLYSTSEPVVARNYLIALAIGDVGHVYMTYTGLGWENFIDLMQWNAVTWGNIAVTAFLLVNRLAYFAGAFGSAKAPMSSKKSW